MCSTTNVQRVLRRAGLRGVRFHDLRHTFAALLIAANAHPKYVRAQLGHASITTTLNVYGHLMRDVDTGVEDTLDRLLRQGSGPPEGANAAGANTARAASSHG